MIVDQSKLGNLKAKLVCLFFVLKGFTGVEVIDDRLHPPHICTGYIMEPFLCNKRRGLDVDWQHYGFSDWQDNDNSSQRICFFILFMGNMLDSPVNQLV